MLVVEESCLGCKFFKDGITLHHECQRELAGAPKLERLLSYRCVRCGYEEHWRLANSHKDVACDTRIIERAMDGASKVERLLSYRCRRCGYQEYWRSGNSLKGTSSHSPKINEKTIGGASKIERLLSYRCGQCGYEGYWKTGNWVKCAACLSNDISWLEW